MPYVVATCTLALGLAGIAVARYPVPSWGSVWLFVGLCILAEYFAIRLPSGGSVSLSSSLALAAVLTGGPSTGALVAALGSISLSDIQAHKPLSHQLFNTAQYVATTTLAGFALIGMGAPPLALAGNNAIGGAWWVASALTAALVLAAANAGLVGTAVTLLTQARFRSVLREFFGWYAVSVIALALLGLVLAELLFVAGAVGTLLIVIPFWIARQTFEVYQGQAMAYRETVRSLVAAIEAKDSYTRGHSERVARYARIICDVRSLPESECQRIEWAALLHDVGKVALDSEMLRKAGPLTNEEIRLVREHPVRASEILGGVDFLEDSVPLIRSHHEWVDGTGYPVGLRGTEIPDGAKILAVADSFDAMTSSRAYRSALSYEQACDELRKLAGAQFDKGCVEDFLNAVDTETVTKLLRAREWVVE